MKKLLYSFIALILVAGLTVAGLELFSRYTPSTHIHLEAPVQTRKSIIIHASPEKVWTIMSGVNQWATWQQDIKHPKLTGNFEAGNSFTWESGGLNIRSTIHTAIPFSAIGWSGPAFGAFAIHNWHFTGLPDGSTRVDVEESMEGWLVTLLSHKFQEGLDTSLDKWLAALKTQAEHH
ncbi:SRPBCC family protein [Chitinophaga arvensicola]|uniref:Polyketide cyclase / dehydrase and lipid transport n=1 Tax=Chitinophaga arvensicola TaxID=29529 RepID=A0A1I0QY23_9BACT|nr:SRPBCC family protein [Chitinophaga arvensicola]SEW32495.1 Polyketide cyclase / dehydrase and lipid transport [Chitinophaga arvensicola]